MFLCHVCKAGPFKSQRGLSKHQKFYSPKCGLGLSIDVANVGLRDQQVTQGVATAIAEPTILLENSGQGYSDAPPLDFPDSLMEMFLSEASAKHATADPTTQEVDHEDDFIPIFEEVEPWEDAVPFPITSPKIDNPSTVNLPDCLMEAMFSPPPQFGPTYLKETLIGD